MVYSIRFKKSAIKGLRRMPRKISHRILKELDQIAADPANHTSDWKSLAGSSYWRLRVGSYRAICELRENELVLLVVSVGPRGDIYK